MNFKELFKSKGLGYWICTGAAVASLIMAIIVFATNGSALPGVHTDGYVIGIVLLLPIIVQAVVTFFPVRFSGIINVALYGIAFATVLLRIPEAVADYFNNVHYQGGNFGMCVFYAVAVLLLAAAGIVGCFFDQDKEEKYLI